MELSNGKILVSGPFQQINGNERIGIALFNSDYTLDSNFVPDITPCTDGWDFMPDPLISSDDKIVVVSSGVGAHSGFIGTYTINDEPVNQTILRFNSSGEIDTGYAPGTISNGVVFSTSIQYDNKVLIAGQFVLDYLPYSLCRLNPDGSKDNSFLFSTESGGYIREVIVKDSLIYIAGKFSFINNIPVTSLAAVDLNGTVVKTFPGILEGTEILNMAIQPDNKVLVFFQPDSPNVLVAKLMRLNENGTIDNSFQQAEFNNGQIKDIKIDENGKIYCSGGFNTINSAVKNGLVRFNSSGSIDNTFVTGGGFGVNYVLSLQILPGGKLMAGGNFTSYRGNPSHGLVVIGDTGEFLPSPGINFDKYSQAVGLNYSNGFVYALGRISLDHYQKTISIAKLSIDGLPLSPTELTASLTGEGLVTLNWNESSINEAGFEIARSEGNQSSFIPIDSVGINTVSFSETIEPFIPYFYKVRAFNDQGPSPYSNVVSVTWNPLPEAPVELVAEANDHSIVLSWGDQSDTESGFIIERTTLDENLQFSIIDSVVINAEEFVDENVEEGKNYFYRVAAFNPAGISDYSNVAESELILGIEANPSKLKIYPNPTHSVVSVEWTEGPPPQLELFSPTGAIQKVPYSGQYDGKLIVDLTGWPGGFYFLRIKSGQKSSISKIFKF